MTQIFGSPGRYIQGYGELKNVKEHIGWIGKSFLFIASKNRIASLSPMIKESFGEGYKLIFVQFNGESTRKEIARISEIAKEENCDCIVGLGGGKVIDTTKAVAGFNHIPVVIIPTIAATDAATGALAVIYNEDGSQECEAHFNESPVVVLVDTEIIMNAPARFLVAGMGDCLSTYFGARVVYDMCRKNDLGGGPTETSMALCRLSYDLLLKHGAAAKIACENKVMTPDLNKIIEANVLLSGLGMESGGGASDHAFYYGICAITTREETKYHGEYVSFSVLCMLNMEGAPKEEIDEVYKFCLSVGLPVCLEDLDLGDLNDEEMDMFVNGVLEQEGPRNHPFPITYETVLGAIKTADALGKLYKSGQYVLE